MYSSQVTGKPEEFRSISLCSFYSGCSELPRYNRNTSQKLTIEAFKTDPPLSGETAMEELVH